MSLNNSESEYRSTPEILPEFSTEGTDINAFPHAFQELIIGIVFTGLICFGALWFAFPDKRLYHEGGLLAGVFLSLVMSFYLKKSVSDAIDIGEYGAQKIIKTGALIRYGIVCIVLGILMIFPVFNPLTAFLGVMTLKVSAYIQPFTNKALKILKIRR